MIGSGQHPNRWADSWPDALAFFAGLGMAWLWNWEATDLVWSLWLSSLIIGYGMILWGLLGRILKTRMIFGGIVLLFFFSLHFGLFHFLHSVFLNTLFPIAGETGVPVMKSYGQVISHYWFFLPAAFIAERSGFIQMWATTVAHPISIVADAGNGFLQPYRNVIRMHILIFFFIFAHFAQLDNIVVYAVVYAAYFFPWRLFKENMQSSPLES